MTQEHLISIEDFPKICRLCLTSDEVLPILSIDELETLLKITHIGIDINDNLPRNICNKCLAQLKVISYFINTCKKSYDILRSIASKQKSVCNEISSNVEESNIMPGRKIKSELENDMLDKNMANYVIPMLKTEVSETVSEDMENEDEDLLPVDNYEKGKRSEEVLLFLCNFCGKIFSTKNGLDRHILSHTGVKSFECNVCGKSFMTKDSLKKHMVIHTGIKAYKCEMCDKCFSQSSHLSFHLKRHIGEKPHKCNFCPKVFLSKYHLERHKVIHSGVGPFSCKKCNKNFHNVSLLSDHNLSNHCENDNLKDSKANQFLCTTCGKCFTAIGTLNVHIRTHTGETPFCCSFCDNSYNNSSSLKRHIMRKHTGEKPYRCQLCSKAYHDSTNLKRHLKRIHVDTTEKAND